MGELQTKMASGRVITPETSCCIIPYIIYFVSQLLMNFLNMRPKTTGTLTYLGIKKAGSILSKFNNINFKSQVCILSFKHLNDLSEFFSDLC